MSKLNRCVRDTAINHEGATVNNDSPHVKLTRLVLSSMLFEDQFYMDGVSSASLIIDLVPKCKANFVSFLAYKARTEYNLRHIPLLLLRELARIGKLHSSVLRDVIQRPDEMGEFLAHYWKDGRCPISHQVRKGLAAALLKFSEYELAKWDKNSASIRVRDILFLTHAKPKTPEQEILFKKIADDKLETPDTWEVSLSAGANKGKTFTRLLKDKKLGALAFLRNLRNMKDAGVSLKLIAEYSETVDVSKVLPFRFIAAAKYTEGFESVLESMMLRATAEKAKLPGRTIILVDVSYSMFDTNISQKSVLTRFDAAAALASIAKEMCENTVILSFSSNCMIVPESRGFDLVEKIKNSQEHASTYLGRALNTINQTVKYDRIIVITDEQSADPIPNAVKGTNSYMINVASYEHGIAHGSWVQINGFSEAVLNYIQAVESN